MKKRISILILLMLTAVFTFAQTVSLCRGYYKTQGLDDVDNVFFKQDDDFIAFIDHILRTLKFTGQDLILPLSSHIISNNDNWGIKPHRLEYILQTANDLQLNFYRYRDIYGGTR